MSPAGNNGEPPRRGGWQRPPSGKEPDPPRQPAPKPPARPRTALGTPAAPKAEPVIAPRRDAAPPGGEPRSNPPRDGAPSAPRQSPPAPVTRPQAASATARKRSFRRPLRVPALISRGERALFLTLLASVLAMTLFLIRFRERVDAHFQARALPVSLASAAGATAPVLLALANDQTGALTERSLAFPLPRDPNTRARVVLEKLLAEYTAANSPHPLPAPAPGTESVDEVFLSPAPGVRGLLATVDLTQNFVRLHPSGIEPETLTLLSMIATLHANLPQVSEVRFLVDGEPRPTLAGHAGLAQTYLAGAAEMAPGEAFTTR